MTTHIIIQDNLSAINDLAAAFGSRLEKLDDRHKLFIMSALALYLYGSHSLEGAIHELDPEAKFSSRFVELLEPLQQHDRHDLLLLSASIANQLAWTKH